VTVRLAKPGSGLGGAAYVPLASIDPMTLALTPGGGVSDHVTDPSVVPLTTAVNCRIPFTRTVTADLGSRVTATAPSTGRYAESSERMATTSKIPPRAAMCPVKAIRRPWRERVRDDAEASPRLREIGRSAGDARHAPSCSGDHRCQACGIVRRV